MIEKEPSRQRFRLRDGRRRRSLGSAEKLLKLLSDCPKRPVKAGEPAASYPISQALLHELNARRPARSVKDRRVWTWYNSIANDLLRLFEFWKDRTIGDVNADTSLDYSDHRQSGRPEGRQLSAGRLVSEKGLMRRALGRFITDGGLLGGIDFPNIEKPVPAVRKAVSREQLARLLWAAHGRKWDEAKQSWSPSPPWDRDAPHTIKDDRRWDATLNRKRARKHVARTILLCAYTASFAGCVKRLRWSGDPKGTCSYVDLDVTPAHLYRLGPDAPIDKLAGKPVLLNRRVTTHLRRWRELDAKRGFSNVIHFGSGDYELSYVPNQAFKTIVKDAGLAERRLLLDDLRVSAARHIVKTQKMVLRSGALLMGLRTQTFLKHYSHLAPGFQKSIMVAFDRKPGRGETGVV